MHRPKAWTRVRGRGYRMDPDEKPFSWCEDWDSLTMTGSVETGYRESDLFFLS